MSRISNIASLLLLLSAVVTLVVSHDNNKVVVLPLVPHHVQKARRRLEGSEYPKEERPTYYHRRRLDETGLKAEQVAALFQGYGTHYADLWWYVTNAETCSSAPVSDSGVSEMRLKLISGQSMCHYPILLDVCSPTRFLLLFPLQQWQSAAASNRDCGYRLGCYGFSVQWLYGLWCP